MTYIGYLLLSDRRENCLERLLGEVGRGQRLRHQGVSDGGHSLKRILWPVSEAREEASLETRPHQTKAVISLGGLQQ